MDTDAAISRPADTRFTIGRLSYRKNIIIRFLLHEQQDKMNIASHSGVDLEQEWVAVPRRLSDWALVWKVPKVTRPWPPLGFSLQDIKIDSVKEVVGFFCLLYACTISPLYSRKKERIDFNKQLQVYLKPD